MEQATDNAKLVEEKEVKKMDASNILSLFDLFSFSMSEHGNDGEIIVRVKRANSDQVLDIELSNIPFILWRLRGFCFPEPARIHPSKNTWITSNYEKSCGLESVYQEAKTLEEEHGDIFDDIKEGVDMIVNSVGEIVDDLTEGVEYLLESVIENATVNSVGEIVDDLTEGVEYLLESVIENVKE